MASVIRIKRRRTDDPVEALLLCQKKSRVVASPKESADQPNHKSESILEFAGTITSKDDPVSHHIKEAIRKKKIHKEMHPHSSESISSHRTNMTNRLRKQKADSSQENRYRITCSRRALNIDNLDCEDKEKIEGASAVIEDRVKSNEITSEDKENVQKLSEHNAESESQNNANKSCSSSSTSNVTDSESESGSCIKNPASICSAICGSEKEEKVFCLIDVEHEKSAHQNTKHTAGDAITVNGVPMTKVPIAEESDDYVYDLYFTHTRLNNIQNEAVITVETLCNEFLNDEHEGEDSDVVYDDEDDSNDEGNWRNDYPDEDPYFFENAGKDYEYRDDMRESLFNGGEVDDEGDLLSYWMDTRCRVGADCSDFEEEYGKDVGGSSGDESP